jgi:hypothetical protein
MTRVAGADRGVLLTWATLTAESSSRMKEKTQSDLRIGLIVGPYFLAPVNDNFRLTADRPAKAFPRPRSADRRHMSNIHSLSKNLRISRTTNA